VRLHVIVFNHNCVALTSVNWGCEVSVSDHAVSTFYHVIKLVQAAWVAMIRYTNKGGGRSNTHTGPAPVSTMDINSY
jgi:hypothetical protein